MLTPGDVFRKFLIGSSVGADQLVVTVTDTDLCHCSLKNCRLVIIRVQYRVIVVIIQQMKWKVRQNVKPQSNIKL